MAKAVDCGYFQSGGYCGLASELAVVKPEYQERVQKWMREGGLSFYTESTSPRSLMERFGATGGVIYLCRLAADPQACEPCPGRHLKSTRELTDLFINSARK